MLGLRTVAESSMGGYPCLPQTCSVTACGVSSKREDFDARGGSSMAKGRRRHQLAVVLMLGVTIVAGKGLPGSSGAPVGRVSSVKRFLVVDNTSERSLLTVVADASTAILNPSPLYAGLKLRVYGVQTGRTIRARRIEVMR